MRHSSKNKYVHENDARDAAEKYTKEHAFVHRHYKCDECDYWHLATATHMGIRVLSLDALREQRRAES